MFRYVIVIPTVGNPDVVIPTLRRILSTQPMDCTRIVLSVNPVENDMADRLTIQTKAILAEYGMESDTISMVRAAGPVGFAKACNLGLAAVEMMVEDPIDGAPAMVVFLNDDALVSDGFIDGMWDALETETVKVWGEPVRQSTQTRPDRKASDYGRIGIAGPVSNLVAGTQRLPMGKQALDNACENLDKFAAAVRVQASGQRVTADFISGFCMAIRWVTAIELIEGHAEDGRPFLFDERFVIGGYEDNDLMIRAELLGWRCVVAMDTFVWHDGHQTLDKYFPGQNRGLANRIIYYRKWSGDIRVSGQRLVASLRVSLRSVQDVFYLRACVQRLSVLVDGISILMTSDPYNVSTDPEWRNQNGSLFAKDLRMLEDAKDARGDRDKICAAVGGWLGGLVLETPGTRKPKLGVKYWSNGNERDERNAAIEFAELLNPDWILSVDHDEVFEQRINRTHLERLMSHPDPMVRSWDFGWLNLWDSPRLYRADDPWYMMRGFRMVRVCRKAPRKIMAGADNGFHCGNVPDHDPIAKRATGIRWLHHGYLRPEDRVRKHAFYTKVDDNLESNLVGAGSYGHLVAEERITLSPVVRQNGIGITMMVYGGERVENVARWLDDIYGVVDHAVLVWTDPWDDDEPTSGPNDDMQAVARMFGAEWARYDMQKGRSYAEARNTGLTALRSYVARGWRDIDYPLGWAFVVDPDEWPDDAFSMATHLRLMAQNSDSYGWIFRFRNFRPAVTGEPPTASETIRFLRLDPDGYMQYHGRVHETLDVSMMRLKSMGVHPQIRPCPFMLNNAGLSGHDGQTEAKLRWYQSLIVDELRDNPHNSGAWVALGLQYENDGLTDYACECFERGVVVSGDSAYLAYRELAMWHLRRAKVLLIEAANRVAPGHPYRQILDNMVGWMRENVLPVPLVGLARAGNPQPQAAPEMPPFPMPDESTSDQDMPDSMKVE